LYERAGRLTAENGGFRPGQDFQYDVLRRANGARTHTPIPDAVTVRLKRGEALVRNGVTPAAGGGVI
jgi:hypothetical protein